MMKKGKGGANTFGGPMNLRYIPGEDGNCTTRKATKEELDSARKLGKEKVVAGTYSMRTCYACNASHAHLMKDDDFTFSCFVCGHWYVGGVDVTEEEEE